MIIELEELVKNGEIEIKTGPFGTQLKAAEYVESGTPVLNVKNLGYSTVVTTKVDYVGEKTLERLSMHILKEGDIVFGRKGAVDRHAYIGANEAGWMQGSDCIRLRVKTNKINPRYLSYYFLTPKHKAFMISMCSHGTTMASLNQGILSKIEIDLPERCIQDRIVSIIAVLDKKRKTNEKLNKNLEQQAEALFHSLFVENANPTWKDGMLSDLGTVVAGGTPSKTKPEYYSEQGIAWITPKDLSLNKSKFISHGEIDISELGFYKSSATKMPTGTVLFSSRAPIGYIAIAANEVTTNQGFKSVVPNENVGTSFMYYLLKFLLPTIEGMASGSTFKEISGAGMKSVPVVIPDNETIEKFNAFCTPIFQQQEVLEAENSRLSDIRDALLPMLMSGELDVSDINLLVAKFLFIFLFNSILSSIIHRILAILFCASRDGTLIGISPINFVLIDGIVAPVAILRTNCFVFSNKKK